MGEQGFRRMGRLERSQRSIRIVFLVLSIVMVTVGLILAVMVFYHLLKFTFNPQDLDGLVTDWATLLANATPQADNEILDPNEGPARWFAIAALLTLGFLLSRIPLVLIRMGTSLFHASQNSQRQMQMILREVLLELRHAIPAADETLRAADLPDSDIASSEVVVSDAASLDSAPPDSAPSS